jgi:hypothetical protein
MSFVVDAPHKGGAVRVVGKEAVGLKQAVLDLEVEAVEQAELLLDGHPGLYDVKGQQLLVQLLREHLPDIVQPTIIGLTSS